MVHLCVSVFISGPESNFTPSPTSSCFRGKKKKPKYGTHVLLIRPFRGMGKSELSLALCPVVSACPYTWVPLALLLAPVGQSLPHSKLTFQSMSPLLTVIFLVSLCFRGFLYWSVKALLLSLLRVDLEVCRERIVDLFR